MIISSLIFAASLQAQTIDKPIVYELKLPSNTEIVVCKTFENDVEGCSYFASDLAKFVVKQEQNKTTLTVCDDYGCQSFTENFTFDLAKDPEPVFFKIDDNPLIENPWNPDTPDNPWTFKTKSGKGTSGFVKAMSKYGKKGVEKASEIVKSIASGADEAGAYIVVDGVRVEGSYNSLTNSWRVTASGSGWNCECQSSSQP